MTLCLKVISEKGFLFIGNSKIIKASLNFLIFNQNSILKKKSIIKPTSKPFQMSALILLQNKNPKNFLCHFCLFPYT